MSAEVTIARLDVGTPPLPLFIADNFVEGEAAEAIFRHVHFLPYALNDTDRADTHDYKHFKHEFDVGEDADPLMLMLAGRARDLLRSQGVECGALYRLYANLNLFGDFQFAHEDGEGWTALLFANSEWREDWGGELLVYPGAGAPFDYAVAPKPGRMVIFDGLIRHRGGVPSKFCHLPRITLAIKFRR